MVRVPLQATSVHRYDGMRTSIANQSPISRPSQVLVRGFGCGGLWVQEWGLGVGGCGYRNGGLDVGGCGYRYGDLGVGGCGMGIWVWRLWYELWGNLWWVIVLLEMSKHVHVHTMYILYIHVQCIYVHTMYILYICTCIYIHVQCTCMYIATYIVIPPALFRAVLHH